MDWQRLSQLPDLPVLLGLSNLEHWSDMLHCLLGELGPGSVERIQRVVPTKLSKPDDLDIKDSLENFGDVRWMIQQKITSCQRQMDMLDPYNQNYSASTYNKWNDQKLKYVAFRDQFLDWHQGAGSTGIILIKSSLEKVRKQLIAVGWKPHMKVAKYHYDFIMSKVPKMKDVDDVHEIAQTIEKMAQAKTKDVPATKQAGFVQQPQMPQAKMNQVGSVKQSHDTTTLTALKPGDIVQKLVHTHQNDCEFSAPSPLLLILAQSTCYPDDSLAAYLNRIRALHQQLRRAKVHSFDKMQMWIVVNGLKKGSPARDKWTSKLAENNGDICLEDLMDELTLEAEQEGEQKFDLSDSFHTVTTRGEGFWG